MVQILSTLVLFALLGAFGFAGYKAASGSRAMRRRILVGGSGIILAIAVVVWWLSKRVPETPGSPGTLVMLTLIWLFGGMGGVILLMMMIGAAFAKPEEE